MSVPLFSLAVIFEFPINALQQSAVSHAHTRTQLPVHIVFGHELSKFVTFDSSYTQILQTVNIKSNF